VFDCADCDVTHPTDLLCPFCFSDNYMYCDAEDEGEDRCHVLY